MEVTRVVINTLTPKDSGTCAICTVTLDDSLLIHQIRVVKGEKGLFIAFPTNREAELLQGDDGKFRRKYSDIVHPCNEGLRKNISNSVLKKYNEVRGK